MPTPSHEFTGRLPPGAREQLQKTVESLQSNPSVIGIEVLPGPDCKVAKRYAGVVYPLDSAPTLPFVGCTRSPCCGCCYVPVVRDEQSRRPVTQQKRPSSRTPKLLFALVVVAVVAGVVVEGMKPAEQKAVEKAVLDKAVAAKALARNCTSAWETVNKPKMKDPSSLAWDMDNAEKGTITIDKKPVPVIAVPYRAKNNFGALSLEQAVCQIGPGANEVKLIIRRDAK